MSEERRIEGWGDFNYEVLVKAKQPEFIRRRKAVELLLIDRLRPVDIEKKTGVRPELLKTLVERALTLMPDGQARGYAGLVPGKKFEYIRGAPENVDALEGKGKAGLFESLLRTHPSLGPFIETLLFKGILKGGKYIPVPRRQIHVHFVLYCETELRIPRTCYPFTSDSQAKRSLERFIRTIVNQHIETFVERTEGGDVATAFMSDSSGRPKRPTELLFGRCQLDAHRIDANGCVEIPMPSGLPLLVPLFDTFSVDLIDSKGLVLGHFLALNGSYNRYDVQRCIAAALGIRFQHEGTQDYLPVHFFEVLKWVAIDCLELDRALAHLTVSTMPTDHPVYSGSYVLPTPATEAASLFVKNVVQKRIPGAIMFGRQRSGKTWAIRQIVADLREAFGESLVIVVVQAEFSEQRPTEGGHYYYALKSVHHLLLEEGRGPQKKRRFQEWVIQEVAKSAQRRVVLIYDDAQFLWEHQYGFLMNDFNQLMNMGIVPTYVMIGQNELKLQRTSFVLAGRQQLVGRFMVREHPFFGVRNEFDVKACLESYDHRSEWPDGSGSSYTAHFFPNAFLNGWRLSFLSDAIFDAYTEIRRKNGIPRTRDIGMQYFTPVVEAILTELGGANVQNPTVTADWLSEQIEACGYLTAEKGESPSGG